VSRGAPPSSAHTYRLLIFKDRIALRSVALATSWSLQPPSSTAFLRLPHQQQRNEIMKTFQQNVNRFI
ncbi:hypothetical protein, partial [Paraburkholderia acidicola]|uniref:hypothetical protein n=1 Tax=Paraburkholderia acidicola TaxID=1912599 RepID=UPI001A965679